MGLVTVSVMPSAAAIPFVIVVFPAARVPCIASTEPGLRCLPIIRPSSIVSSADFVCKSIRVVILPNLD